MSESSPKKENSLKVTKTSLQSLLPQWKRVNPQLKRVYSKILQMLYHQIWSNIKGLAILKENGNRIQRINLFPVEEDPLFTLISARGAVSGKIVCPSERGSSLGL